MAPALDNVGNLVRLPTGCGEQNMVGLVPNIYLLNYLNGVGKKVPEVERKAINYMNIGYKRQQNYRHRDGSYSIWGDNSNFGDKDGSTWLTAFVVKAFSEASQYISVDASLVQQSIDWLFKNQMENGCFRKRGYVHSSYLKGGLSDDSLTSFVLTALKTASLKFKEVEVNLKALDNAYNCMLENVKKNDLYTSIVVAHAAATMGKEDKAIELLTSIEEKANTSTGLTFWELKKKKVTCKYCWWSYRPSSEAVEMTAYNILTYVKMGNLPQALPSVKWLAKQRNSQGGFVSTQDTVVALEALSEYMKSVTKTELNMDIDVMANSEKLESINLNDDNALLLQSQKLTQLPTSVDITSTGSGCAMIQTVLRYNTKEVKDNNAFSLNVTPMDVNSVDQDPTLKICSSYTGAEDKTGMVLIEVELVTGWEAVTPERLINEVDSGVQRVETDKEENKVVLYFDELTRKEHCVSLEMKYVMIIDEAKDALVTVYDYYNREETASVLYNMEQ